MKFRAMLEKNDSFLGNIDIQHDAISDIYSYNSDKEAKKCEVFTVHIKSLRLGDFC